MDVLEKRLPINSKDLIDEGLSTGHLPFFALSLASLVFATLVATSLKFSHAITHTAGVGLERRSRTAGLTSRLVGIRKFA